MPGGTLIMILAAALTGVSAKIIKCIERNQYKVNLNCPADHVIYRPMIYLGANPTNTCQEGEGDCAGVPLELEKEMKSCFWQPSCKLSWNKSQTFTNPSCQGMAPTYAVYDNPTCVRNDELYDIGSRDDDDRLSSMFKGIIRSSGNYPYHFKDLRSSSVRKLPSRPGYSLILTIDDLDLRGQNSLTIYTNSEEKKTLLRKKVAKDETFQVVGENIYILFNITAGDRPGGFILRFEYKKDEISNNVMLSNHGYPGRSVSVKGSLDSCIARKDSMRIVCPDDHVIFQPDVTTGVSNGGKCLKMDGDCQGLTHSLITEINRCYWRSTCRLTWRKGIPLTMTNTLNCLAQYPDYISVKNYECIKKDYVYGMCENKEINSTEGIIVSHSNYPWHYSTKATVCRKYVSVDSNVGMRIYTQQIDLDPDSKGDNIKFYVGSSKKPVKKIMAGQRADLTFEGGCVMIKFTVSKRSKGGQGFILRFEPPGKYPTKMKKTEDITCEEMFKQRRLTSTQHFAADSGSKKKDRQMRKQTRRKMQRGQDKEKEKAMSDAKKPEVSRRLYNVDRIMKRKQRKNRQGRKGKGNRKRKSSKRGRRRRKGKKGRKNKGRRISKHVRPFFPY